MSPNKINFYIKMSLQLPPSPYSVILEGKSNG